MLPLHGHLILEKYMSLHAHLPHPCSHLCIIDQFAFLPLIDLVVLMFSFYHLSYFLIGLSLFSFFLQLTFHFFLPSHKPHYDNALVESLYICVERLYIINVHVVMIVEGAKILTVREIGMPI